MSKKWFPKQPRLDLANAEKKMRAEILVAAAQYETAPPHGELLRDMDMPELLKIRLCMVDQYRRKNRGRR